MTAQQLKNSILQMAVQGKLVPQDPKVPIIPLMRKSAMKCGRWPMKYRLTSPIRGSGCGWARSLSFNLGKI